MDDNTPSEDGTNTLAPATPQLQSSTNPKFSSGSHIRSRITVVCAECKRLKLKCDRRNPCGSCLKRDTVHRCQYSAAAAEKIDVQSLHNRLQLVESQMAQIIAGGLRLTQSAPVNCPSDSLPFPHNDRAILATGNSGSSITISLDEVAALWLEHIDLPQAVFPDTPFPSSSHMQLEPAGVANDQPPPAALLPPLNLYYPPSSSKPCVSPALVALLPSAQSTRSRIATAIAETMRMHPCFNMKHFRSRLDAMFAWAKENEAQPLSISGPSSSANDKAELARSIFFGKPLSPSSASSLPKPPPTLSFFASATAAYALGVLACKENEAVSDAEMSKSAAKPSRTEDGRPATVPSRSAAWQKCTPGGLFALSQQALSVFEMSQTYDLDSLVAMILHILFLLHGGKSRISHLVFPLVGKMVNIAFMMGLATDPDEFTGKYSLFDAEMRRRVWWDVVFYDVFVADCTGHSPLIQDNTYTTKMPADVDEEQFTPASISLPVPVPRGAGGDPSEVGFGYFIQKCRLAQLVKNVKKRQFKDPLREDASLESSLQQAEEFESEVKKWLSDLPRVYRLDLDLDSASDPSLPSSTARPIFVSPSLRAQRCELAILANRLVLKVSLPFLKSCADPASEICPRRIVSSIIDASHTIIQAARVLHDTWKQMRPAAFAFYSFGRTLFDASVMAACAVISHPTGVSSGVALSDVDVALEIMKDPKVATGATKDGDSEKCSEAVKVLEMLKTKADGVRRGDPMASMGPAYLAGMKRKRSEVEDGQLETSFDLPYVGAGVTCSTRPAGEVDGYGGRASTSSGRSKHTSSSRSKYETDRETGFTLADALPIPSTPLMLGSDDQEELKPQIPIRGRPRQESTRQRGSTSGRKHARMPPVSLHLPVQVASLTPEPLPYRPSQDVSITDVPSQSSLKYIVPFGAAVEDQGMNTHESSSRLFAAAESSVGVSYAQHSRPDSPNPTSMYATYPSNEIIAGMRGSSSQNGSVYGGLGLAAPSPQPTPSFPSATLPTHSASPYDTVHPEYYSISGFGPSTTSASIGYDRSDPPMMGLGMSDSRPGTATASTPVTSMADSPSYAINAGGGGGGGMALTFASQLSKPPNGVSDPSAPFQDTRNSMQPWPSENGGIGGPVANVGDAWPGYRYY
ncbi:hypothetical protein EW146_g2173 [Bondarzewia mesenterica]|uniref:Zn(2)-C6 fungal-type domain-containing protein n=1 Tax=Bondarzewia mesenterica TaxID=1095465 RepID=A0A4S4M1X9_9AGAM|nr:hypothetical protein EW146_g2173 [Bondarzewia mesenterica]